MDAYSEISSAFINKPILTRRELKDYILTQRPVLKDSTFGWLLYDLCQKRVIQRVAHDAYQVFTADEPLKSYSPDLSGDACGILASLKKQFPLVTFAIWETRAFNEFANHQTARNYIFIEAEKPLDESVFNAIHEQGQYTALYRPSEKEITLYSGNVTVVVLPLTTEAPLNGNYARLEKLLVDLFANKLLERIISKSDYPGIYEEAFSRYDVNYNMMTRYARRRNKDGIVKRFIKDKTNVGLNGKGAHND